VPARLTEKGFMRAGLIAAAFVIAAASLPAQAGPQPVYKTIAEDASESRRIVSVRLDTRVGEDELARIATVLRKGDQDGRRTLVNFYLQGMSLKETSWATATFAPALKISVHGLTLDEEAAYRAEAAREKRPVVGMWLTQAPAVPGLLVIYREKSKLFAEWRVRGGHRTVEEVIESRWNGGRRFDIAGDAGQHYVLVSGGVLELREKSGLIAAAEPVKAEPATVETAKSKVPKVAHVEPPAKAAPPPAPAAPAAPMRPVAQSAGFTVTSTPAAPTKIVTPSAAAAVAPAAAQAPAPAPAAQPSAKLAAPAEEALPATAQKTVAAAPKSAVVKPITHAAAAEKGAKAQVKKRIAKAEPAAPPKKRFESDVSAINRRLVN
jgi:hypothetical protein